MILKNLIKRVCLHACCLSISGILIVIGPAISQDVGWLAGVKVSDGRRGVFPENFTKRID